MKWFRMYHDARTDAKLESLTDEQFRIWFRLLCFANEQPTRGVIEARSMELLAVEVARGNVPALQETLRKLEVLSIVRTTDLTIEFVNWQKRQFASDNSTDRWHTWKNKQRANVGQTLDQQLANSEPTPPDTDTEVIKKNMCVYTPEFEEFWRVYPRKVEKRAAFKVWNTRLREGVSPSDLIVAAENYAKQCAGTDQKYIKHPKTFLGPSRPFEEYITRASPPKPEPIDEAQALIKRFEEWDRTYGANPSRGIEITLHAHSATESH